MVIKVSSFLHSDKKREKAHHSSKAKSLDGPSKDHATLAELHEAAGDENMAKCHKSMSKRHAADAEQHRKQADACDSAISAHTTSVKGASLLDGVNDA
jgi:hypothetical protein